MTPDPNAPASKSKDPKKDKKPGPSAPEDMPPAPSDVDLKHVYDAHFHAFMAVKKLVSDSLLSSQISSETRCDRAIAQVHVKHM